MKFVFRIRVQDFSRSSKLAFQITARRYREESWSGLSRLKIRFRNTLRDEREFSFLRNMPQGRSNWRSTDGFRNTEWYTRARAHKREEHVALCKPIRQTLAYGLTFPVCTYLEPYLERRQVLLGDRVYLGLVKSETKLLPCRSIYQRCRRNGSLI